MSIHDNKICQWYCCDCGQSYGTIIFKDKQDIGRNNSNISTVKYYSSILYNKHIVINESLSPMEEDDYDYLTVKNVILKHTKLSIVIPDNMDVYSHSSTINANISHRIEQPHPHCQDDLHDNDEATILVNGPKRFNCHRCQHMMCPYCPKIRYKDL